MPGRRDSSVPRRRAVCPAERVNGYRVGPRQAHERGREGAVSGTWSRPGASIQRFRRRFQCGADCRARLCRRQAGREGAGWSDRPVEAWKPVARCGGGLRVSIGTGSRGESRPGKRLTKPSRLARHARRCVVVYGFAQAKGFAACFEVRQLQRSIPAALPCAAGKRRTISVSRLHLPTRNHPPGTVPGRYPRSRG